jgi:hypothetical protein
MSKIIIMKFIMSFETKIMENALFSFEKVRWQQMEVRKKEKKSSPNNNVMKIIWGKKFKLARLLAMF